MPSTFTKILALSLLCSFWACDNKKTPSENVASEMEPDLESFRQVELDSAALFVKAESEVEKGSEVVINEELSEAEEHKVSKPKSKKKPKAKKRGVITFDSLVFHLPDMKEGDVADLNFVFKNEGEGPLSIKEVDVVCGCTTPEVPFLDILPGEKGKIGIKYNSVGKEGLQEPEITVLSNGIPRKTTLKIVVNITPKKASAKDSLDIISKKDSLSN